MRIRDYCHLVTTKDFRSDLVCGAKRIPAKYLRCSEVPSFVDCPKCMQTETYVAAAVLQQRNDGRFVIGDGRTYDPRTGAAAFR